jgi:acyl-coenzyme A synthetase/AMP-(fatty) acid ligase
VGFVVTVAVGGAAEAGASVAPHGARPAPELAALEESIRTWANEELGKTQRLAAVCIVAELPRNAIGKVLKRELRARWEAEAQSPG